ncbi:MAG: glucuronate isomerase [Actinobacteria bacterium]|uniref:Uronate isomerase n=1 Tax=freshwater metagenome TaxID=449393 RepID=A0A6J6QLZ8_9ZZZZ|nr:glucuronate isomerase [Actinomycetota bacterium]MSW22747.1 glucuronate isomerase [Actinomycetota bacterium]MSX04199.1 glucuronate isomerase [Actinomycetota bacterium]MSX84598.1 glucuronate isomerase [Actinomycetota bacterium]MSY96539.1 glucuronate isomerase [Actinomycetota bacterium]
MANAYKDRYLGESESLPLARTIYGEMRKYPIISPHGHVDAAMILANKNFTDPVALLMAPDHYILRMLHSQGVKYEKLAENSSEENWKLLAENWKLFRSTPSRIWFQEILATLFDVSEILAPENALKIYNQINTKLQSLEFKPQALFKKFNIELLATTDGTADSLDAHIELSRIDLGGRIIPTFRPDGVSDPERADWKSNLADLGKRYGIEITSFANLLAALRSARAHFKDNGATATDHGVFSARTLKLESSEVETLFAKASAGTATKAELDDFRAAILFEHALMAADDGMVMQIHPGSLRNYDAEVFAKFGADKGFDIPVATTYTSELQPLLNAVGKHPNFKAVIFTLDESTYSRELAPLAGAYPSLRLGPPWWFHDSLNGLARWRDAITETAGYYNTVGFIDDTRAFASIPVRHDVARRFDSGYLAREVSRHRITENEAMELAGDLAYNLSKDFFNL